MKTHILPYLDSPLLPDRNVSRAEYLGRRTADQVQRTDAEEAISVCQERKRTDEASEREASAKRRKLTVALRLSSRSCLSAAHTGTGNAFHESVK